MEFKGLYTALITPFTIEGSLDIPGLRYLIQNQLDHQVQGIVIAGSTGESATLTMEEKIKMVEVAVEEAKGKAAVIMGTGSYSTAQTIAMTQTAQELGADAALLITPYYNKPTQEGLYRHFAAVCESVSIPLYLYNNPGRTGQNLEPATLKRLSLFPSIKGIKECSGNMTQMGEFFADSKENRSFSIMAGDDGFALPLIAMGAKGLISSVSNLFPSQMKSLVDSCLAGDFEQARQLHYQLLPLFKAMSLETNPIPIKTALQICGMPAGPCRLPLCEMAPHRIEQLQQTISLSLGIYGQTKPSCC